MRNSGSGMAIDLCKNSSPFYSEEIVALYKFSQFFGLFVVREFVDIELVILLRSKFIPF